MISLNNVQNLHSVGFSLINKVLIRGNNTKPKYMLLKALEIKLSNEDIILIPKGFEWDLSSVPRFLWWLLPRDGDFDLAYLIHDYLYINKKRYNYSRDFVDDEMYLWAKTINSTKKLSLRNIDNFIRYIFVKAFGGLVWKNKIKIK